MKTHLTERTVVIYRHSVSVVQLKAQTTESSQLSQQFHSLM